MRERENKGSVRPVPAGWLPVEVELIERVGWFITLRWYAAAAIFIGPLAAGWIPGVSLPRLPIQTLGALVALYNALFHRVARRLESLAKGRRKAFQHFASVQILVDWIFLTVLIHWTGGVTGPLQFFYIFHTIIACLLLSAAASYAQVTFAAVLVSAMALGEAVGVLPHHPISAAMPDDLFRNPLYVVGRLFFLVAALYATVYLATSVTRSLRRKDASLVEAERQKDEAYRRLAEIDQARTEFVRKVTHELRAPLSGAESMLSLLTDGYLGDLTEQQADIFRRIRTRIGHLREMVNDLLDLARGETAVHSRPLTEVDVTPVLDELCRKHEPEADARGLEFRHRLPQQPVLLYADPQDFAVIVNNLLSNAIKYTPRGGRIEVAGGVEDDHLEIRVSDSGIGIPPEDRRKLFTQFFRSANAREHTPEGTGLGLAIVKRVVERYSGAIAVDSEPGKGTTFHVRIPLPYCRLPHNPAPPGR